MTVVFDALAHPARRHVVEELRSGPRRVGDLGLALAMTREAVSKHVRILVDAGVIVIEQRGRERWCTLAAESLVQVDDWLSPYRELWAQRLDALATEVARGSKRAQPAHSHHHSHREGA